MLTIDIPEVELYDEKIEEFVVVRIPVLRLEHSLVSLSKWESRWQKPFLSGDQKTREETIDYIRHMTITQNVDSSVYSLLPDSVFRDVKAYIEHPMTATTFAKTNQRTINREIITAEIIYYWMIALNIPMECQKWHLNRLLTLINVCQLKNQPKKKMTRAEIQARNRALNAQRRAALGTTG